MTKPVIKVENGMVSLSMGVGMDLDKDGVQSIGAKLELVADEKELLQEIVKDKSPEWLKKVLGLA